MQIKLFLVLWNKEGSKGVFGSSTTIESARLRQALLFRTALDVIARKTSQTEAASMFVTYEKGQDSGSVFTLGPSL